MSTAESSWTKRSSSMRFSSSAIGCSKSRKVVFTSVFYWDRVQGAPQVPARHRAPGAPGFRQLPHPPERDLPVLEVRDADGLLHTEVVDREHVGAQQVEH